MAEASQIVSNLIMTPAIVYTAPLNTAVPADTVAAGTAWGGSWVNVGYLAQPLKCKYEAKLAGHSVENALTDVRRRKTEESLTLETVLAELYLTGLTYGMDGTVTATPAGVGQPGKEEMNIGGGAVPTERMWGFEGSYVDEDGATFPVRLFVWKATSVINGELLFSKKEAAGIPLQISALADLSKTVAQGQLFRISKILEPAS